MSDTLYAEWILPHGGQTTRPVVAALHGMFGSVADWREILLPFADSYDLCLVTLPGHGRRTVDSSLYAFDGFSRALNQLLSEYDPSKRHLLGYSLGGRLAAYATLTEQMQVASLGLVSSHLGLDVEDVRWGRILSDEALACRLVREPLRKILSEWYDQPIFAHAPHDTVARERFVLQRENHDSPGLARALRGFSLGWQPNLWTGLRLFRGELLYLAGGEDKAYTDIASYVFALHPGRRARILPELGHDLLGAANAHMTVRERLQAEIAEWLLAVEDGRTR